MISFNLNCIMQLKQFYDIATKVRNRKRCYYFWWSTWPLRLTSVYVLRWTLHLKSSNKLPNNSIPFHFFHKISERSVQTIVSYADVFYIIFTPEQSWFRMKQRWSSFEKSRTFPLEGHTNFDCSVYDINTLRPRQNGRHFADDTFNRIFMNENVKISINVSLKFVPKGLNNNIPALVQIMAWRRPGDKPLSEPMIVRLPTHICVAYICVARPQWVLIDLTPSVADQHRSGTLRARQNGRHFADDTLERIFLNEHICISIEISLKFVPKGPISNMPVLVQIMALRRLGDKPLSEPMIVRLLKHICATRPQWVNHHSMNQVPQHMYCFTNITLITGSNDAYAESNRAFARHPSSS